MKPQDRTRAILRSKLEPSKRLLLVAIADHMDAAGVCWVRPETMAEETGLSHSTVDRLLTELQQDGVLRRWWGEHRAKDIAIVWESLLNATSKATNRGGKRTPKSGEKSPNIGDHTPIIGDDTPNNGGPPDNRVDGPRTSGRRPPNIGEMPPDVRPRSDQEAANEATREAPTPERASAREPGEDPDPRNSPIPDPSPSHLSPSPTLTKEVRRPRFELPERLRDRPSKTRLPKADIPPSPPIRPPLGLPPSEPDRGLRVEPVTPAAASEAARHATRTPSGEVSPAPLPERALEASGEPISDQPLFCDLWRMEPGPTAPPRVVPELLADLLGEAAFSRPAMAIARAGITPEVLVRMTEDELRYTPGVGGAYRVIADACARAGFPLAKANPTRGKVFPYAEGLAKIAAERQPDRHPDAIDTEFEVLR
jgi:hypothetical protein